MERNRAPGFDVDSGDVQQWPGTKFAANSAPDLVLDGKILEFHPAAIEDADAAAAWYAGRCWCGSPILG